MHLRLRQAEKRRYFISKKDKITYMQAIILAAGMGRRLAELTRDNTKCMVEVNGVSLIDRLLGQLARQQLSRVVIVIGYKGKELKDYLGHRYDVRLPECGGYRHKVCGRHSYDGQFARKSLYH